MVCFLNLVLSVVVGNGQVDIQRNHELPGSDLRCCASNGTRLEGVGDINGLNGRKGKHHWGKGSRWKGDRGKKVDKRRKGDDQEHRRKSWRGDNDEDQGWKWNSGRWGGNDQ